MPEARPAIPEARDPLQAIADLLRHPRTDTGLIAALRRHHPVAERRRGLFEVHQVFDHAGIAVNPDEPRFDRWALLVHCLALARGAHVPDGRCGAVLADIHVSEARVRQLIEADWGLLQDLLPLLARRLAASSRALDWRPIARLVLNAGLDEDKADAARSAIVQGWLRGVLDDLPSAAAEAAIAITP